MNFERTFFFKIRFHDLITRQCSSMGCECIEVKMSIKAEYVTSVLNLDHLKPIKLASTCTLCIRVQRLKTYPILNQSLKHFIWLIGPCSDCSLWITFILVFRYIWAWQCSDSNDLMFNIYMVFSLFRIWNHNVSGIIYIYGYEEF